MSTLVLSSATLDDFPFHDWLRRLDAPVVALVTATAARQLEAEGARPDNLVHVEGFAAHVDNPLVELRAHELHERHRFTRVLAAKELDVLRAARLREAFQVPGQGIESALCFRDKARMKAAAAAAGIAVPPFRAIASASDVHAFIRAVGYPIVLKPALGTAGVGVQILRGPGDLHALLPLIVDAYGREDRDLALIAERYVPHRCMYTVGGLVVDGEVVHAWPSRYLEGARAWNAPAGERWPTHSATLLAADNPLVPRLAAFLRALLRALPTPRTAAFHAEVFHTDDDRLLLCEIASRPGGGLHPWVHAAAFGVLAPQVCVEAECGLPLSLPPDVGGGQAPPRPLAGRVLFLRRPGRVRALPQACPFPWVDTYRVKIAAGAELTPAAHCTDAIASAVVVADDEASLRARVDALKAWFECETVLEPTT